MKETTINYIESKLERAKNYHGTNLVDTFEAQAFGALELYCRSVFEENPAAEAEMIDRWNNGWRLKFETLRFSN